MTLCLTHPQYGYYMTRDPLGATGDFTTAPEISQMFGELIGIWAAAAWRAMGSPENVRLVELGPGRGTLMLDALRAAKVMPDFRAALVAHLVEISPALERLQRQNFIAADVPVSWHKSLRDVPEGPLIIIANEFLDALPTHQAVMCADGWHERVVKIGEDDNFHFSIDRDPIPLFDEFLPRNLRPARIGEIFEWRTDQTALELARRLVQSNGVALLIDYGHSQSAIGETLQAVGGHEFVDPLLAPGEVDLTAHVDFQAVARAAESMRARSHGPIEQGEFLRRLGIEERVAVLKAGAPHEQATAIQAALIRLTATEHTGMGRMIKVLALSAPKITALPAFDSEGRRP
jgi:SAM-dependent MidA family methyltransferase